MAKISAFKAIRPTRDKVHLVAAKPLYAYKKNVLEAKLEDNRFTFLHIVSSKFSQDTSTKPNSLERFNLVSERYNEFIEDGILIQDDEPALYIYRQTHNGHRYTGIICGASIEEYKHDQIKKHEATITSREEMFINYLDIVGYNAEPVLLSHSKSPEIDQLFVNCMQERPEYEFTTTDYYKHEVWVLSKEDTLAFQEAFEDLETLYIADGHHRTASSVGLFDKRKSNGDHFKNEESFLAYLIDENHLDILEFNRLIKNINNHSKEEFLRLLNDNFFVETIASASKPLSEHELHMYLEGSWYRLQCKDQILKNDHPVKSLDAQILTDYILSPILNIHDLKSNNDISFMSGAEPLEKIESKVLSGEYSLAFVLYPVTMSQIKKVADNNMIMPPKSTWVEPKLRSGLTIYNINE